MKVDFIIGPAISEMYGINRYQTEIYHRLFRKGIDLNIVSYKANNTKNPSGRRFSRSTIMEALRSYISYPLIVRSSEGDINHITNQSFAYLANILKKENTIVTCHDLIPYVYDESKPLFYKFDIRGLRKAKALITDSKFSKEEIIKYINYPEEDIHVIYNGVNHEQFYKTSDKSILNRIKITEDYKVILYVGSEQKRQNVPLILKSFAKLKELMPKIKFLKIGNPQCFGAREKLLKLVKNLNIVNDVFFLNYVPEAELRGWYNSADLFVYPCSYAGFGLPPLEAMACGTPVITSNVSSLPETVGEAAVMVDPSDVDLMADKMYEILNNNGLRDEMIKEGLKRSKMFNWDIFAKETLNVYEKVYSGD